MAEDNTPTNVVDEVVVTSATENLKQSIPTNADGNIVIYRATTNPNVNILSDFTDINMSNQAGLGQQSFYAIDEMYAYNYSRPSINKNVYKFETNIKPSQVLNIQSPTNAQISVLEKIGITSQDLKNWDMFNTGEVNTKIQNNLDFLLENNIKAIGNNKVGGSPGVFDYEIVPIITEKTQTEIKPVSQLILDPNWEGTDRILNVENELFQSTQSTQWADKYLPIDVNDPNTKYRPVYYVDEEGIGTKAKDFQFSEQPIENNLVKDNLIEVPVDTNTNVNLVNDTYVLSTDAPTNVVDEGLELYHSISKGETVNKKFHAGTLNAALDRASQFYGGEQLYKVADDNIVNLQGEVNDLIFELSEKVDFENIDGIYEITEDSVEREVFATINTGFVQDEIEFKIVAETFDNELKVKFQDLDGYDGAEIYSQELIDIDYKPDNLQTFVGDIEITGDKKIADGFLDEIGLLNQAGEFNYKDGYDLYKVKIKPNVNVLNIPDTATFVEFGKEKEMSADFIQGFIERPNNVDEFKNITQIIIDGKTYDITNDLSPSQALQEHFKGADVLAYKNDIEDPGSKSYMFLNENSYVLEKVDDTQFNIDVANKYIQNNPYETISTIAKQEAFTEPERYQVLKNALLNEQGPGTGMGPGAALANNTAEFVNQLPIEQTLKDKTIERIGKHTAGLAAKAATPDPLQALDIYEDFVMLAGLAYAFAPDIDTFVKNQANNMLETMAGAAGYKVKLQDFEYDWERVSDTMDWVESVSPTDIVIKKVGEVATGAAETGMVTGFGYIPKDLSSTLGNTLTTATTTKEKERDPMYDRIKRTFSGQY